MPRNASTVGHGPYELTLADLVGGQIQGMFLAHNNPYDVVAGHAIARAARAQGVVRRERRKVIGRRSGDKFPAADLLRASGPRLRLDHMVREPSTFNLAGAVNVALLGVERVGQLRGQSRRSRIGGGAIQPCRACRLAASGGRSCGKTQRSGRAPGMSSSNHGA